MMTSFYNLLKYAQTGITSPDMTYYDKLRASTLMGGVVQTLTGQPPLSFKADGTPLISWSMKGNGSQTGTPTHDNPVMPEFVGVRTANLFDKSTAQLGYRVSANGVARQEDTACSDFIFVHGKSFLYASNKSQGTNFYFFKEDKTLLSYVKDFSTEIPSDAFYVRVNLDITAVDTYMLNLGSTALPYEPYGYKIPFTCAGQTTPVYLGQTQTVRKIRKLVLTGEEGWTITSNGVLRIGLSGQLRPSMPLCTHYIGSNSTAWSSIPDKSVTVSISGYIAILDTTYTAVADWKSYLAAQYAAGHPVTVWYVLAEAQTAIVNEPLAKIGDYADELSSTDAAVTIPTVKGANTLTVETELQPSEMTITGRIQENA